MAIDRNATAWVLYDSGQLFKVSTSDASCTPTSFAAGQQGLYNFGMGFASNSAGSSDETLFISRQPAGRAPGPDRRRRRAVGHRRRQPLGLSARQLVAACDAARQGDRATALHLQPGDPQRRHQPRVGVRLLGRRFLDLPPALERPVDGRLSAEGRRRIGHRGAPDSGRHIVGAGVSTCAPTTTTIQ
jgi:hypothetical protein